MTRPMRPRPAKHAGSGLLDTLKGARIRRLFHVGFRIVLPELRDVLISRDRYVPELAVAALDDLADVNVVDRITVGVELDGLAKRRAGEFGLQDRIEEGTAVFDFAIHLFERLGDPHHAGVHRKAVQRGYLAVLRLVISRELL